MRQSIFLENTKVGVRVLVYFIGGEKSALGNCSFKCMRMMSKHHFFNANPTAPNYSTFSNIIFVLMKCLKCLSKVTAKALVSSIQQALFECVLCARPCAWH